MEWDVKIVLLIIELCSCGGINSLSFVNFSVSRILRIHETFGWYATDSTHIHIPWLLVCIVFWHSAHGVEWMCNLTRSNTVCESLTGNGCSLKVYLYNFCCWQFLTNRLFYFPNIIKIVIWSFEMVQDWTWWNKILWKLPNNYLLKSAFLLIKLLSQFSFLNLWNCWISVAIFFFLWLH